MAKQTLPNSRTVALPFSRIAENHPHLFRVNPGVDASLALEHVSLLLAAAYDMASDAAQDQEGDELWGMAYLIEMAKSVVDSVSGGLVRGAGVEQ